MERKRDDWDTYFMQIARAVAARSTCPRGQVGAVFVRERRILSTGYNGSVIGTSHCDEVPEEVHVKNGHCDVVIHAEINAIIMAASSGVRLKNSTLYCTHLPCWNCAKAVLNLRPYCIVYEHWYRLDPRVPDYCRQREVLLGQWIDPKKESTT